MTVILVLATFGIFLLIDSLTGKRAVTDNNGDVRFFDHANDEFAGLGVTMADGGEKIK